MLIDGLSLPDSAVFSNLIIESGAVLASSGNNLGELFYKTGASAGLHVYNGAAWAPVGSSLAFTPVDKAGDTMTGALILNADPVNVLGAATKQYVDTLIAGLSWKTSVRVATTAAGTLATSFASGSLIDSVTLDTGNRILIKNQASAVENGIYVVNASGAPTRASDANASVELDGAAVYVTAGTTNVNTAWTQTAIAPTLGSSNITFAQFNGGSSYVAGAGLSLTGNTFANTGVRSIVAGANVTISGSTGDVTINAAGGVAGGSAGSIVYQSSAGVSATSAAGVSGQVLLSGGSGAPGWAFSVPSASEAARATNLAGGAYGSVPWQSGVNSTSMLAAGSSGQFLTSLPGGAVGWTTAGAAAGTLTGTTLAANVVSSSLTSVGTLANLFVGSLGSGTGTITTSTITSYQNGSPYTLSISGAAGGISGGNVTLFGGTGSGNGGTVAISGGAGANGGANVTITGGAGSSSSGSGGAIIIGSGTNTVSVNGVLTFKTGATQRLSILGNGAWSVGTDAVSYGTSGQVLTSTGSGSAPTWQTASAGAAAAGSLTGTTLASNVVSSSLTSVGSLANLFVGSVGSGTGTITTSSITSYANGVPYTLSISGTAGGSTGGNVTLSGGTGSNNGGTVAITGGNGANGGANVTITGGAGNSSSGSGGAIIIGSGTNTVGTNGALTFKTGATQRLSILSSGAWSVGADAVSYGTAGQVLTSAGSASAPTWQNKSAVTALTSGATVTPNFDTSYNFSLTAGISFTLANPSGTITPGQQGTITITQDATGSRVISWGSNWKAVGGTKPVLSTAANAVDMLSYYVISATSIVVTGYLNIS